jgi:hypothetical protein
MRLQVEEVRVWPQHCCLTPVPLQLLLRQQMLRARQRRLAAAAHGPAWLPALLLTLLQAAVLKQACAAL